MKLISLLIAEDHQLIIDGLINYLKDAKNIEVITVVKNGKDAIEVVVQKQVDVILLDINMPVMNGYETAYYLSKKHPNVKIIVLTTYIERGLIEKMIEIGVCGYILKSIEKEELLLAINKVANGEKYFSNEISLQLILKESGTNLFKTENLTVSDEIVLTRREREVLRQIAKGLSHAEIAKKLYLSKRTVDTHRANIIKKLKATNVTELIKYAIQNGLIDK